MKHTNKKGFTIVELVIVIAVIAILAAVLIPNLSRLVEKANESKALQEAENAMKADLIEANGDYKTIAVGYYVVSLNTTDSAKGYYTKGTDGKYTEVTDTAVSDGTTYYAKYQGVVPSTGATYEYTANGYKCTFTVATGAWETVKTSN